MNQDKIKEYANKLVKITIKKHKENSLGKEKMSKFIRENLKEEVTKKDYDKVLLLYSRYLAKEGYEIMIDINKFNIINYNSDEYQIYRDNLSEKVK